MLEVVLKEKVEPIYGAGRTDAGVHARGQVANFFVKLSPDLERLKMAVSSLLRREVVVVDARIMPDDFHARRSATSKLYVYSILNRPLPAVLEHGRAWWVAKKLDLGFLNEQAKLIEGTHDFTSFRASGCGANTPIKTIHSSEFRAQGQQIFYSIKGSGFLKQMVRIIVGTLVELGVEKLELKSISQILDAKNRRIAGVTAPAHGLCLEKVFYD